MSAAAGKKEHDLAVLIHGSIWPRGGSIAFHYGHSDLGRRSVDW